MNRLTKRLMEIRRLYDQCSPEQQANVRRIIETIRSLGPGAIPDAISAAIKAAIPDLGLAMIAGGSTVSAAMDAAFGDLA